MTRPVTYYTDDTLTLLQGSARAGLASLDSNSVNCCLTSPPYFGLRDYGVDGQIGLEETPEEYVAALVDVFREVRRVLAKDGTLWLNLGDSYVAGPSGSHLGSTLQGRSNRVSTPQGFGDKTSADRPMKNLLMIPERVALALQDDGWILRNKIVWHKPNAMPESVRDRLSTTYETVFLLAKSPRYWFDLDPIREPLLHPDALGKEIVFGGSNGGEGKVGGSRRRGGGHRSVYGGGKTGVAADTPPGMKPQTNRGATGSRHTMTHEKGRNPGDVWSIPTQPYHGAHHAVMPLQLARRCVLAGCKPGGTVLDPFAGTGTSLLAAQQTGRRGLGIELNPASLNLAMERLRDAPLFLDGGEATA